MGNGEKNLKLSGKCKKNVGKMTQKLNGVTRKNCEIMAKNEQICDQKKSDKQRNI